MEPPTFKDKVEEHLRHYRLAIANLPVLKHSEYQVAVGHLTEHFAELIQQDAIDEMNEPRDIQPYE